jgi:hypothetical protein
MDTSENANLKQGSDLKDLPLIFMGHDLGGCLIKQVRISSNRFRGHEYCLDANATLPGHAASSGRIKIPTNPC